MFNRIFAMYNLSIDFLHIEVGDVQVILEMCYVSSSYNEHSY